MRRCPAKCLLGLAGFLLGSTAWVAWAADPLERLDPEHYGPGTLIVAMEELERYRPREAVDLVQPLLSHPDPDVARTAAWLLRRMGQGTASVEEIGEVLASAEATTQQKVSAALSLGELRASEAIAPLSGALGGGADSEVRAMAARALGELHRTGSAAALSQAVVQDSEPRVRACAAGALGSMPHSGSTACPASACPGGYLCDAQGQCQLDPNPLMTALKDADPAVRVEAAWALGRHRFREAIGNLQGALQDQDCRVGSAAAWALSRIGDPAVVDALQAAAAGPCRLTAQAALWALSEIPH